MRILTSLTFMTLAGCGGSQEYAAAQSAKTQQARVQCDSGLEQHSAYMKTMPPKAASARVAVAWNTQQEAKIQSNLELCKAAMRQGLNARWFVAEVRQGEAYEKLMVEMAAYYDAVAPKEKPEVLRRVIDAIVQAKGHYGFAIRDAEANPELGAQNGSMLAKAKSRVPALDAKYTALKAVQAKQYE